MQISDLPFGNIQCWREHRVVCLLSLPTQYANTRHGKGRRRCWRKRDGSKAHVICQSDKRVYSGDKTSSGITGQRISDIFFSFGGFTVDLGVFALRFFARKKKKKRKDREERRKAKCLRRSLPSVLQRTKTSHTVWCFRHSLVGLSIFRRSGRRRPRIPDWHRMRFRSCVFWRLSPMARRWRFPTRVQSSCTSLGWLRGVLRGAAHRTLAHPPMEGA